MGSKSSASASTTNNTRNSDQSLVDSSNGDGSRQNIAIGGDVSGSVTLTDHGAVEGALKTVESTSEKAFTFAKSANDSASSLSEAALTSVGKIAATAAENSQETVGKLVSLTEQVKTDGQAQTTRLIAGLVVALLLAGVATAWIMNRPTAKAA